MDRFLRLSLTDRARAFEEAGTRRGLSAGSVEKDFWVCLMLRELFTIPKYGEQLTFKGGTSLSKAWGLIDRFSEDIDLTITRESLGFGGAEGPEVATSRNEQQRRLQRLKQVCGDVIEGQIAPMLTARLTELLSVTESWRLTSDDDDPDGQTLLFAYPRLPNAAAPSYIRPTVKLEFGARSDPWPIGLRPVTPFVAEEFSALFDSPYCTVRALLPERTFWEKVMLLHEENFRPPDKKRQPRLARHYYDVWRLIESGVAATAVADLALFEKVAAHRQLFFRYSWMNYDTLKRGTIQMVPHAEQLDEWRRDYAAMHGEMFFSVPPTFDEILASITAFQSEINKS